MNNEIIQKLEAEEAAWKGHAAGEALSGNVVKEAQYKGTAAGIRIAIAMLHEHTVAAPVIQARAPSDVAAVLRKVIADNWGQPSGVTVPALDEVREALAFLESQPTSIPKLNIRCECDAGDGIHGSTYLDVVRVDQEDDDSFTAVTNHWPRPAPHDDTVLLDWLEKEPMENLAAIKYGFLRGNAPTVRACIREHMKLECDSSQA